MMAATGCDGVVVGRGCLGRPWLFAELVDAFAGRAAPSPRALGDVVRVLAHHADLLTAASGEPKAMRTLRRHSAWYLQGYPVGDDVRRGLRVIETRDDLDGILDGLDPSLLQKPGTTALPRGRTDGPSPVILPRRVARPGRRSHSPARRRARRQRRLTATGW